MNLFKRKQRQPEEPKPVEINRAAPRPQQPEPMKFFRVTATLKTNGTFVRRDERLVHAKNGPEALKEVMRQIVLDEPPGENRFWELHFDWCENRHAAVLATL